MNRGAGAQQALMRLSQQLSLRGHSVEVWFLYRKSDVDTGDLDVSMYPRRKSHTSAACSASCPLGARLRKARPDAVISFLPLANTLGLLCRLARGREGADRQPPRARLHLLRSDADRRQNGGRFGSLYGDRVCVARRPAIVPGISSELSRATEGRAQRNCVEGVVFHPPGGAAQARPPSRRFLVRGGRAIVEAEELFSPA